jgi:hypothetical protein
MNIGCWRRVKRKIFFAVKFGSFEQNITRSNFKNCRKLSSARAWNCSARCCRSLSEKCCSKNVVRKMLFEKCCPKKVVRKMLFETVVRKMMSEKSCSKLFYVSLNFDHRQTIDKNARSWTKSLRNSNNVFRTRFVRTKLKCAPWFS